MGLQISFSAAERYLLSPFSYFAHYFLRLRPTEYSSALIFGNAIDIGINSLLKDKQYGKSCDLLKAKSVFEEQFSMNFYPKKGVVKFSKADLDESLIQDINLTENPDIDPAWYSLREKGFIMLEAYYEQVLPRIHKVFAVQENIDIKNQAGDSFIGIVDFIAQMDDGKVYLMDNKTSSKKYDSDAVQTSQQLATYFEALKGKYKLDGIGYCVILKQIRKKKLPLCEIQVQLGVVDETLIEQTFKDYEDVLHGIKNGKFECSKKCQDSWWGCCYSKYCESQGTDLTGLEFQKKK